MCQRKLNFFYQFLLNFCYIYIIMYKANYVDILLMLYFFVMIYCFLLYILLITTHSPVFLIFFYLVIYYGYEII